MIQKNYFKNMLFQKKKFILVIFIVIGILTLPYPYFIPRPELDSGGVVSLYTSYLKNFQVGQDAVSQFGPLAFLYAPAILDHSLWFLAFIYRLSVHSFFLLSIALFLFRSSVTWKEYLIILLMLPIMLLLKWRTIANDYEILAPLVIFLYLTITHKIGGKYEMPILFFVSFLLAVESLIKFNLTIASLSMIVIFSLISVANKESRKALVVCISYSVFLLILWGASGQHFANLPSWFVNSLEVGYGYNYGMAIDGPKYQIFEGGIAVIFAIILLIYALAKRAKNLSIFILLNIELLFQSFKHGFVRQDQHVMLFFFFYGLFFALSYIIYKQGIGTREHNSKLALKVPLLILFVLCMANILFVAPTIIWPNISLAIPSYEQALFLIFDQSYQTQMVRDAKAMSINHYQLDNETIYGIGNKTMDIIPWDVALPWAYDLNWSPRPMWWSFQVFSPNIDRLNAQHFLDEKEAPQTILYAYKSIDGRYPLFDEPSTFSSILQNYQYTHTSGEFVFLSHSPKNRTWGTEENLGTVEGKLGEPIKVPKYYSGYEFAEIDLRSSPVGKIMSTIYKPSLAHIKFKFSDQTYSQEFRFFPGASKNGVFVSQYVDNIYDLESIFSGKITPNIDEIIIYADDPAHYEKNVQVKFVGVPSQISIQESKEIEIPEWSSLKLIQGGMASIDWIGNNLFSKEGSIVNVNKEMGEIIPISGWAVDDLANDGTVKTFLVFQDRDKEITLPTIKSTRPDLISVFEVNNYVYGGWKTVLDTKEFEHECYTLSLRIPRSNGQEYFEISGEKSICFGT